MGLSAREKPLRAAALPRKRHVPRPPAAPIPPSETPALFPTQSPSPDPPKPNPNLPPPAAPKSDEPGWGYCPEEQLEELLLANLDRVYKDAISRLVSLGHSPPQALRAVLRSAHRHGPADPASNILPNALLHLGDDPAGPFSDLRRLEEFSLAGMLCLLRQIRPRLSRGEAMWCLLMSGLHVGRASSVELPAIRGGPPVRERPREAEKEDLVQLVLRNLEAMGIEDEAVRARKMGAVMDLVNEVREAEGQVGERKEWAQEKAVQAARKLSGDLHELRMLRMEREADQRAAKGKEVSEDATTRRLAEMESALKKAGGQVDRANAAARKMEAENAEVRAEVEASKLSASESVAACLEVSKREKKYLKKLVAWEKHREKVLEEIGEKRKKIVLVQQQLAGVQEATKQVEVR